MIFILLTDNYGNIKQVNVCSIDFKMNGMRYMKRLSAEDKRIIKEVLDIKGYDPDTFDPEILNELETITTKVIENTANISKNFFKRLSIFYRNNSKLSE